MIIKEAYQELGIAGLDWDGGVNGDRVGSGEDKLQAHYQQSLMIVQPKN